MTSDYRIIGSQESPQAVKVRAYLQYKGLPYSWHSGGEARELLQNHGQLPSLPLVVMPDQQSLHDSTEIIKRIEAKHPDPPIQPDDAIAGFMSLLLEEFADEWGSKWVFHYRWAREADQLASTTRLAGIVQPDIAGAALDAAARQLREQLMHSAWFTHTPRQTAIALEASFKDTLALLEPHLAHRPFLFGKRPALADFGLWGQLQSAHCDPTPRGIMEIHAPNTLSWLERMHQPSATGAFESWQTLADTLAPLVRDQLAGLFLPWSTANAGAVASGAGNFSVTLRGETWDEISQTHPARTLAVLRETYQQSAENTALNAALENTDCLRWLAA